MTKMTKNVQPVLVEMIRGDMVESTHRGAYALYSSSGTLLESVGSIDRLTYARSTLKFIQALPLLESGAADHFMLTDEEITLACASHSGEREHTERVHAWLRKIGLEEEALECGTCAPQNPKTVKALMSKGISFTALHNPCSGKHAGFLTLTHYLKAPLKDYVRRNHLVQQIVEKTVSELFDYDLKETAAGIDGCSIPVYGIPLKNLALGFARFSDSALHAAPRRNAVERILKAVSANPFLLAGSDRFDTRVISALNGNALLKVGAEGVYAGIFPALKAGLALKIEDGSIKAAEVAVAAILARHGFFKDLTDAERQDFLSPPVKSIKKETIGSWRASF